MCVEVSKTRGNEPPVPSLWLKCVCGGDGRVSVCPLSVCFALEMLGTFSAGVAVAGWCCHSNLGGLLLAASLSSRPSACLCPPASLTRLPEPALCVGESVRASCIFVLPATLLVCLDMDVVSGGWRQHYLGNCVSSVQIWPLRKGSASLT